MTPQQINYKTKMKYFAINDIAGLYAGGETLKKAYENFLDIHGHHYDFKDLEFFSVTPLNVKMQVVEIQVPMEQKINTASAKY